MNWTTQLLTPDRFDDFADVINRNRREPHCWCVPHRLGAREIDELGQGDRERAMRRLCELENPPGLVTYLDGTPVGWCNVGPRAQIPRLVRSALIRPVDVPVWSIVCLVVRSGHRRRGVTTHLIAGAVQYAASRGAPGCRGLPGRPAWPDGHHDGVRRYPVDVRASRLRGDRHDRRGRVEDAPPDHAPSPGRPGPAPWSTPDRRRRTLNR